MLQHPTAYDDADACADAIIERVGNRIVLGLPLGLGKAAHVANALFRRARDNQSLELKIFTALTLERPHSSSFLEQRFLDPVIERLYADYAELEYAKALRRNDLPPNIEVSEFYFQPAAYLGNARAQQSYVSINYSHAAATLIDRGVNVIAQLVAARATDTETRYSLSSNTDVTLDVLANVDGNHRPLLVGQVCSAMPFMPNEAELPASKLDMILENPRYDTALYPVPNEPIDRPSYAIAVHVASMIEDGGTLQVGIGSLGDAITHVVRLRHQTNSIYRTLVERLVNPLFALRAALPIETADFTDGLYASSEMVVEGFLYLAEAGVLKRRVPRASANESRNEIYLHGGFFLGSDEFYQRLRDLPEPARNGIEMTGISFTNTLRHDRDALVRQRRKARFVNSAMMVTLSGAVVSDGLADGRVVSGVGGQHDFVTMAHELPGARSIITLPATRTKAGRTQSNIVFNYPHATIARHLRDIVVTEYGAADLRGCSDRDVIAQLLAITDSRFQDALLGQAKAAGKIENNYRIPDRFRRNSPETIAALMSGNDIVSHLPRYPFGTDFTDAEARIVMALVYLKERKGSWRDMARLLISRETDIGAYEPLLARMQLAEPRTLKERLYRRILAAALVRTADAMPLFPLA